MSGLTAASTQLTAVTRRALEARRLVAVGVASCRGLVPAGFRPELVVAPEVLDPELDSAAAGPEQA